MANIQCSTSTFNPSQFLSMIRCISPGGGGLEEGTHLIDALSVLDQKIFLHIAENKSFSNIRSNLKLLFRFYPQLNFKTSI